MARYFFWSSLAVVAVTLIGCATARSIRIAPGEGGEIAISPGDRLEARQKAEVLVRSNCRGKDFKVVTGGEVVVGMTSSSDGSVDQTRGAFGGLRTSARTEEKNL